jgi:osmotically-inducible protein OsmY
LDSGRQLQSVKGRRILLGGRKPNIQIHVHGHPGSKDGTQNQEGMNMNRKIVSRAFFLVPFALLSLTARTHGQVTEQGEMRIQREVRHELLMLPYLDVFDNITFKVEGYKVTLLGEVTRPALKSDAENVVKRIEGVENVDNQIEVLPPSRMDDQLRLKAYRAIYDYPALERYAMPVIKPIRIIVKSGNITLEGVVDSEADKNLVNLRARGVAGAFSVTNNLRVEKSK